MLRHALKSTLWIVVIAFSTGSRPPAHAQILHPTADRPSFEVATIKPWKPTPSPPPSDGAGPPKKVMMKVAPAGIAGQTTDRVHAILPIDLLIASAYNLPIGSEGRRILGPDWLHKNNDQYEIQAKIEAATYEAMQKMTPAQQHEQVALMEQSLLADRFKLQVHFETREMPVFALVIAKGQPRLTPAKDGETSKLSTSTTEQGNETTATAVTLEDFAKSPLLTGPAGVRSILNQTGLTGAYDFTLKWTPDQTTSPVAAASDAPSLFTAIQEQLGLKLIPSKAPVEVIVIDHIELPSTN
jgi:bla regulator protein BlaR1